MDWRLPGNTRTGTYDTPVTASSLAAALTVPTVANTKSAYTTIIAALPFDTSDLLVVLSAVATSNWQEVMLDLAVGGAGAEQVVVPNLLFPTSNGDFLRTAVALPLSLRQGDRVAARYQSTGDLAKVHHLALVPISGGLARQPSPGSILAWGTNTADSGGTSIDPGAAANTKGAWTQVVAATERDVHGLHVAINGQGNTARTNAQWLVDVAVGPGGSETVIAANLPLGCATPTDVISPAYFPLPVAVPAGTRLAARAQCSITDAADRLFDLAIYGA